MTGPPRGVRGARGVGRLVAVATAAGPYAVATLGLLLAWTSQISLHVTGLARVGLGVLGVLLAATAVGCLLDSRPGWRAIRGRGDPAGSRPVWAWFLLWAGLALSAAVTWHALPAGERPELGQVRAVVTAREEITQLAASAAAGTALLLLSAPRRALRGFRWLWLAVLVTTAPVALREILTNEHIVVTRWIDWYFTPNTPAGTFSNPNNYGCVLVAVTGTLLAWAIDRVRPWASAVLVLLAAGAAWLTWTTLSRGAFAAIAVQLVIVAVGVAARLGVGQRLRGSRPARFAAAGVGAALALAALAAFVVPSLAARNPLLRAPKADEAASDDVRINLIRAGLRYWESSPWVGTGPGTYEYHLTMEKPPGVPDPTINAHNAFVEILSQYGLLGAVPVALLLGLLLLYVVRPPRGRRVPGGTSVPDTHDISRRVELGCVLVAFVVTAIVVSSALALPMWFVMLAHAVALARSLGRSRARPPATPPARPPATAEQPAP